MVDLSPAALEHRFAGLMDIGLCARGWQDQRRQPIDLHRVEHPGEEDLGVGLGDELWVPALLCLFDRGPIPVFDNAGFLAFANLSAHGRGLLVSHPPVVLGVPGALKGPQVEQVTAPVVFAGSRVHRQPEVHSGVPRLEEGTGALLHLPNQAFDDVAGLALKEAFVGGGIGHGQALLKGKERRLSATPRGLGWKLQS